MLNEAKEYAFNAHADQKYGDKPYSYHLDAVVSLLEPYGTLAQVIGYLHDVVEDTEVSIDEIENQFGKTVSECVAILTDESGRNRKERKQKTYAKMSRVSGDLQLALVVKAADRLANVLASVELQQKDKLKMYQKEHRDFKAAVYRQGLCDDFWEELDRILIAE